MPEIPTSDTGAEHARQVGAGGDRQRDATRQMGRMLDEGRTKIDELLVQLDLADLDIRDGIRRTLATARSVHLAERSRLSDLRGAGTNPETLRLGLDQRLRGLLRPYDVAEAVMRRRPDNR